MQTQLQDKFDQLRKTIVHTAENRSNYYITTAYIDESYDDKNKGRLKWVGISPLEEENIYNLCSERRYLSYMGSEEKPDLTPWKGYMDPDNFCYTKSDNTMPIINEDLDVVYNFGQYGFVSYAGIVMGSVWYLESSATEVQDYHNTLDDIIKTAVSHIPIFAIQLVMSVFRNKFEKKHDVRGEVLTEESLACLFAESVHHVLLPMGLNMYENGENIRKCLTCEEENGKRNWKWKRYPVNDEDIKEIKELKNTGREREESEIESRIKIGNYVFDFHFPTAYNPYRTQDTKQINVKDKAKGERKILLKTLEMIGKNVLQRTRVTRLSSILNKFDILVNSARDIVEEVNLPRWRYLAVYSQLLDKNTGQVKKVFRRNELVLDSLSHVREDVYKLEDKIDHYVDGKEEDRSCVRKVCNELKKKYTSNYKNKDKEDRDPIGNALGSGHYIDISRRYRSLEEELRNSDEEDIPGCEISQEDDKFKIIDMLGITLKAPRVCEIEISDQKFVFSHYEIESRSCRFPFLTYAVEEDLMTIRSASTNGPSRLYIAGDHISESDDKITDDADERSSIYIVAKFEIDDDKDTSGWRGKVSENLREANAPSKLSCRRNILLDIFPEPEIRFILIEDDSSENLQVVPNSGDLWVEKGDEGSSNAPDGIYLVITLSRKNDLIRRHFERLFDLSLKWLKYFGCKYNIM